MQVDNRLFIQLIQFVDNLMLIRKNNEKKEKLNLKFKIN